MKYSLCRRLLLVLLPILVLAFGCSDFEEIKSRKLYVQAERLFALGQAFDSGQMLSELEGRFQESGRKGNLVILALQS